MNPFFKKLKVMFLFLFGFSVIIPLIFMGLTFSQKEKEPVLELDNAIIYYYV